MNFYAMFRELAGGKSFDIEINDNATIKELLEAIREQIGEKIYKRIKTLLDDEGINLLILVNGRNIKHLKGIETKIKEKDRVDIFPPAAGG